MTLDSDSLSEFGSSKKAKDVMEVNKVGPYVLGKTLGHGTTGRVKLGTNEVSQKTVAIKIINKNQLKLNPSLERKTEREIAIMKLIEHPNVLGLYDVYESPHHLFLVLEYVEGGELFDYLVKKKKLDPPEALAFFKQIVSAVDFCHSHRVCHRDLKPENLLLDAENNIKIADFGFASFQAARTALLETSCGSPHYASPEVIRGEKYDGAAADVWSSGVILYALLTGTLPFDDDNVHRLLRKVKSGVYTVPSHVPQPCQDLLKKMLTVNPKERFTFAQVKKHSWFLSDNLEVKEHIDLLEHARAVLEANISSVDEDVLYSMKCLGCFKDEVAITEELLKPGENMEKIIYSLLKDRKKRHPSTVDEYSADVGDDAPRKRTDSIYFETNSVSTPSSSGELDLSCLDANSAKSKLMKRLSKAGAATVETNCIESVTVVSPNLSKKWISDALTSFAKFSPRFRRRSHRDSSGKESPPTSLSSSPKKSWFGELFGGNSSTGCSDASGGRQVTYIDETFFTSYKPMLELNEAIRETLVNMKIKYQSSRFAAYKCKYEYMLESDAKDKVLRARPGMIKFRVDIVDNIEKSVRNVFISLQHGSTDVFRELCNRIMLQYQLST